MSRNRFNEEKEFEEITAGVKEDININLVKKQISTLIPKDIKLISKNDSQKKLINSIKNNEITICAGLAGTGKTFVALAYALSQLRKTTNRYNKIYLFKSVKPLKDEEVGFIKGSLNEKIEPVMWSYFINMEKIISNSSIKSLIESDIIRLAPISFIRGGSLDDCIIIADEVQNITLDNSRTLMTRIGSNCKMIMLGDVNQIDMKNKEESSLKGLIEMFENTDKIGIIKMDENDVNVRNPLISVIEAKFKEFLEKNKNNKKHYEQYKKQQLNG